MNAPLPTRTVEPSHETAHERPSAADEAPRRAGDRAAGPRPETGAAPDRSTAAGAAGAGGVLGLLTSRTTVVLLRRAFDEYMRSDWRRIVVILGMIGVIAGVTSLYPLLVSFAFDALESKDTWALTTLPWIVALATLARGAALYGQMVWTTQFISKVQLRMRSALYRHLITADLARLSREPPAALTQRFTTDFALMQGMFSQLIGSLLRDGITLVALVIAMFVLNWKLALIAFVILPVAVVPVTRVGKRLRQLGKSTQVQSGVMASLTTEAFGAAREVKSFGLEDYLSNKAEQAFETIRKLGLKAVVQRARMEPILEAIAGVAIAVILTIIGYQIANEGAQIGDFLGFMAALLIASQPIRKLSNLHLSVQMGVAGLERFYATMDEQPAVTERPNARDVTVRRGEIVFDRVGFAYGTDDPALIDVSFTAPPGKMTAIVGRSGAGKSTVFNLLPRLYDISAGSIAIDGVDIRDFNLASLRKAFAVVSQEPVLFNDTVAVNIGLGRLGASREEIERAAAFAQADAFIARLPQGYDTVLGDRGARLSGGERQRIALARAFLKDAPILLLDEATSALDSDAEAAVKTALTELAAGRTTLVIAHRLSTIRAADRIVVMDRGQVVDIGTHDELMATSALYARFNRLQFGGTDEVRSDA